jgi:hypothetical protein
VLYLYTTFVLKLHIFVQDFFGHFEAFTRIWLSSANYGTDCSEILNIYIFIVNIKNIMFFWDVMPCSLVDCYQSF